MSGIDTYTKLLLHCDGADGSTTFIDNATGKTVTAVGNAQIDTAQFKFGSASGLFDGSGDRLTLNDHADWYFGTGDFTIDCWVRFNALPSVGNRAIFYAQYIDGNNQIWFMLGNNSGNYQYLFLVVKTDSGISISTGWLTTSISTNTWYHVAVVRNGNNFKVFQAGSQVGSTVTDSDEVPDLATGIEIGGMATSGYDSNGWIDEFRISKGIARWTANFTPPTSAYSKPSGFFLLMQN